MSEQVSQPTAVVRMGFVTAPVLHIGSVGQDYSNMRLKQVEDRLPVAARTLHHGVTAALGYEPLSQSLQLADDGAEFLDLCVGLVSRSALHHADHNKLLPDVDSCTLLDDCLDHLILLADKQLTAGMASCSTGSPVGKLQSGVRLLAAGQIIIRGQY